MRIGLTERVPMDETEYIEQQLENSRTLLFCARSVREAQFFQNRLNYLTQKLKQVKSVKMKGRIKGRRVAV